MGMTLEEARATTDDSVLSIGSTVLDADKKDRAIIAAFSQFLSATNAVQTTTAITLAAGTSTVNIVTTIPLFVPDFFVRAFISFDEVELTTWDEISDLLKVAVPKQGKPRKIAIKTPTVAAVWPVPKIAYSMDLTITSPLTAFTPGTGSPASVDLLVSTEFAYRICWTGVKAYLLRGAPGHPDADAAQREWEAFLVEARAHFAEPQPGVADRQSQPHPAKQN